MDKQSIIIKSIRIKWHCGSEYEGEVLNGIRNGYGVFKCKDYVYKGCY